MTETLRTPEREDYKAALGYIRSEMEATFSDRYGRDFYLNIIEDRKSRKSKSKPETSMWLDIPQKGLEFLFPQHIGFRWSVAYTEGEKIILHNRRSVGPGFLEVALIALQKYAVEHETKSLEYSVDDLS